GRPRTMSELISIREQWLKTNDAYLSQAMGWLRQRLTRLATTAHQVSETAESTMMEAPPESPGTGLFGRRHPASAPPVGKVSRLAAKSEESQTLGDEFPHIAESAAPPALVILVGKLGLTAFERNVLLLCIGMELDTRIAGLCARAQDDPHRT